MPVHRLHSLLPSALLIAVALGSACATDGPQTPDDTGDTPGRTVGPDDYIVGGEPNCSSLEFGSCEAAESDYIPTSSESDGYPACISDGGRYELVADPPGSIGRVEAFESMAEILWRTGTPSASAFEDAREIYETEEGLKSRLERREDLHFPEIPKHDWEHGVDEDKQCSVEKNVAKYPERCAGPALINPLLTRALLDGIDDVGDPRVHAARIEAAGLWFLYLSVYKEAFTCTDKPKDCDSSWAYYAGGAQVDGGLLGFAKLVHNASEVAHQRIFDGVLAVRCFRDLYDIDKYPSYHHLPRNGKRMFDRAWGQLDTALHAGYAAVLRARILQLSSCDDDALTSVHWNFVQTAGPVLNREARDRDRALGDALAQAWTVEQPTLDDLATMVDLLDAVFPCP